MEERFKDQKEEIEHREKLEIHSERKISAYLLSLRAFLKR